MKRGRHFWNFIIINVSFVDDKAQATGAGLCICFLAGDEGKPMIVIDPVSFVLVSLVIRGPLPNLPFLVVELNIVAHSSVVTL